MFEGRALRKEYWMFGLFSIIITYVLEIFDYLVGIPNILYYIYALAVLIPALAMGIRRKNNINLIAFCRCR